MDLITNHARVPRGRTRFMVNRSRVAVAAAEKINDRARQAVSTSQAGRLAEQQPAIDVFTDARLRDMLT